MMRHLFLLVLASALVLFTACTPPPEPSVIPGSGDHGEPKVFQGHGPDAPEHRAVVALHQLTHEGRAVYNQPFCTGTLIREDVVLTAAHCLADGVPADGIGVFVGDQPSSDARSPQYIWKHLYTVTALDVHEGYSADRLRDDVGILRLGSDAASTEGVVPVPELPSNLGLSEADVGVELNIVGFGLTETGGMGVKLQADLPLAGPGCVVPGCPNPGDAKTQLSYAQTKGGGPCSGDSGGPAFVVRDGRVYVAGLTSYGDAECVVYGVSTHTAPYESWISGFADGRTDSGWDSGWDSGR